MITSSNPRDYSECGLDEVSAPLPVLIDSDLGMWPAFLLAHVGCTNSVILFVEDMIRGCFGQSVESRYICIYLQHLGSYKRQREQHLDYPGGCLKHVVVGNWGVGIWTTGSTKFILDCISRFDSAWG